MTRPLTDMVSSAVVCKHHPRAQLEYLEAAPRLIYLQVGRKEGITMSKSSQ